MQSIFSFAFIETHGEDCHTGRDEGTHGCIMCHLTKIYLLVQLTLEQQWFESHRFTYTDYFE